MDSTAGCGATFNKLFYHPFAHFLHQLSKNILLVGSSYLEFVPIPHRRSNSRPSWLTHLIALVTMSPEVGMAGPMSNYAAPPQLVETVPHRIGLMKGSRFYDNLPDSDILVNVNEVQAFAKEFAEKHKGRWLHADRLGGFCLLLKRQVLTKIGVELEPWTELRLFDTDI